MSSALASSIEEVPPTKEDRPPDGSLQASQPVGVAPGPGETPPLISLRGNWVQLIQRERTFLVLLGLGFLAVGATYDAPHLAMWVGFGIAGYAAVANDSIQTIGTFIASNKRHPWWLLWLYIGGIFLATTFYGWWSHAGDVSYGRLLSKGFERAPQEFAFLQVAAPLFLVILTRLRMPVSTTFLLLSCFSASASGISGVLLKSLSGYAIAFGTAITVWLALGPWLQRRFTGPAHPGWTVFQWLTSGFLWALWLIQDLANIAVFLPRSLGGGQVFAFAGVIFLGLGLLFRLGGDKIQQIVDEKSDVVDVRAATVIDLVYCLILLLFTVLSSVPMSTTWVFIGLLGGRELAMSLRRAGSAPRTRGQALALIGRDVGYAAAGLLVSLVLAAAINERVREAFLGA